MSRYIDRRKAIDRIREGLLKKMLEDKTENCFEYARLNIWAKEWLNELPTAEVQEIKRGHWIVDTAFGNDVMSGEQMVICSVCGKGIFWGKQNYCPNCGAYMVNDEE